MNELNRRVIDIRSLSGDDSMRPSRITANIMPTGARSDIREVRKIIKAKNVL